MLLFRICPVVPYVGTWIEMITSNKIGWIKYGRSLRGNVDRNSEAASRTKSNPRRSLRGNVDRNFVEVLDYEKEIRSFPTWERG